MENSVYDVLCVGMIAADVLVSPVNPTIFDRDVSVVHTIEISPGGDATNEAVATAALGLKTGLIAIVGEDDFGNFVTTKLKKSNVDISLIRREKEINTVTTIVLIKADGSRNFLNTDGLYSPLRVSDIAPHLIRKSKIVCIGSLFALPRFEVNEVHELYETACSAGTITMADACFTGEVNSYSPELMLDYVRGLDYFLPSRIEASVMTGANTPEKISEILLRYVNKAVVIKLGADGCYIASHTEHFYLPAFKTGAIDTTGAGDNFVGGFAWAIHHGLPLRKCGIAANAAGALSTQKIGANGGIESECQLRRFVESNEADF
jgi:sugar/nucleoside kinase (ribokinase family)